MTRDEAVKRLDPYPNLQAILIGTVSGHSTEWPMMRPELIKLLDRIDECMKVIDTTSNELQAAQERIRKLEEKEVQLRSALVRRMLGVEDDGV